MHELQDDPKATFPSNADAPTDPPACVSGGLMITGGFAPERGCVCSQSRCHQRRIDADCTSLPNRSGRGDASAAGNPGRDVGVHARHRRLPAGRETGRPNVAVGYETEGRQRGRIVDLSALSAAKRRAKRRKCDLIPNEIRGLRVFVTARAATPAAAQLKLRASKRVAGQPLRPSPRNTIARFDSSLLGAPQQPALHWLEDVRRLGR